MDRLLPGSAHEALEAFLGHWSGTTHWEATAWGPARTAAAEVVFARAAAGLAVTMSYRHTDADGAMTQGVGVFTTDPDHPDTLCTTSTAWACRRRRPPAPAGTTAP